MRIPSEPNEADDWSPVNNYTIINPYYNVSYAEPKRSSACWTCLGPDGSELLERKQEG